MLNEIIKAIAIAAGTMIATKLIEIEFEKYKKKETTS